MADSGDTAADNSTGWLLVMTQFVLITWLIVLAVQAPVPGLIRGLISFMAAIGGVTLFGFTIVFNRMGNWRIHPVPREDATLITGGPYRLIRHPMYAAVLLVAVGVLVWTLSAWAVLASVLLVGVLASKMQIEERRMRHQFGAAYQTYMTRTRQVIPGIW